MKSIILRLISKYKIYTMGLIQLWWIFNNLETLHNIARIPKKPF